MHLTSKPTAMRTVITGFFCFLVLFSRGQEVPETGKLAFTSHAFSLCVTPEEKIIVVTRAGEIAWAESKNGKWRKTSPEAGADPLRAGLTLDQANFFNKDTGFVSGFISHNNVYNIIYHTTDGGLSWKPVVFGKGGWVDDAVNLRSGEAWMSVSGDGIYYTTDHGFTWQLFKSPEPKQRFARIFFNSSKQGLIGSLYNLLAYTEDNCVSWKFLPTPLDQKAYIKTSSEARPEINNVAILPDIFLVKQEELVFWSRKDSIEWKLLKGYTDFYTDEYNSALYFKKGGQTIVKTDLSLTSTAEIRLNCGIIEASCRNGELFVFSGEEICTIDRTANAGYYPVLTSEKTSIEPEFIGIGENGYYGHVGNKIYSQKQFGEPWTYAFTLPFAVNGGSLTAHNQWLLYSKGDSLLYYSVQSGFTEYQSAGSLFSEYGKHKITEMTFEVGSQGCFHNDKNTATYRRTKGEYKLDAKIIEEKRIGLSDAPESIDAEHMQALMDHLPHLLTSRPSINDLNIGEEEYEQCRRDIIRFRSYISRKRKSEKEPAFYMTANNIDFDRLLALVDTIKTLETDKLNMMLGNLESYWSTTTNWRGVEFINAAGQKLMIINRSFQANSLLFPWTVQLNGYSINVNSIAVTNFIKSTYPGLIGKNNRVDILHQLVKQLYFQE